MEVPVSRYIVSKADDPKNPLCCIKKRILLSRGVVNDNRGEISLGNHIEDLEIKNPQPSKAKSLISRINDLSSDVKQAKADCSIGSLLEYEEKKKEEPMKGTSLISRINNISSNLQKYEDVQSKVESDSKISTMSLISRLNKVTKPDISTTSLRDDDAANISQESEVSITSDSLISAKMLNNVEKNENDTSDMSDGEREPKVMEITKKFGGAKKKCIDKIRSKISKSESKNKLEIKQDLADCLPALIYIMTPFLVMIVAAIMNFFWTRYYGLELEEAREDSFNFEVENLVNEE